MDLAQIPLFAMLKDRMGYLTDRQKIIAENVANADTPGYAPHDLKPFSFHAQVQAAQAGGGATMAVTEPGHMQAGGAGVGVAGAGSVASGFKAIKTRDSEVTLDGNQVVLEDEMIKLNDTRMDYEAALNFYEKSMSLLREAAKAPGK